MGEAATRKVTEIEQTRQRLEDDIKELEDRLPAPLRSTKAIIGSLIATAGGVFVLKKVLSRGKKKDKPQAEVVVRIVRDDLPGRD